GDDAAHELCVERVAGELGNEIWTPTLNGMRLPRRMPRRRRAIGLAVLLRAVRDHRRVGGLAENDLRLRPLLREHAPHALECSAGAEPSDPIVESLALEVGEDFL